MTEDARKPQVSPPPRPDVQGGEHNAGGPPAGDGGGRAKPGGMGGEGSPGTPTTPPGRPGGMAGEG